MQDKEPIRPSTYEVYSIALYIAYEEQMALVNAIRIHLSVTTTGFVHTVAVNIF